MPQVRARRKSTPAAQQPVYLDCNATTPMEPQVLDLVVRYMTTEFGNAGSRTHEYGTRAKKAIERARDQIAQLVGAERNEVIFTSGATESNNLALLGLAGHGEQTRRKHIVSTMIEHKAVLGPLAALQKRGFEVELVAPTRGGWIDPDAVAEAVRPDTLLVSLMHVNNETGVVQPIQEVCERLHGRDLYLHVDAAQGFGKEIAPLRSPRIDLISVSAHKVYGPKGIGALITRRRGFDRVPLTPLTYGGDQERGLRSGTHPVALIAGFGEAASLAAKHWRERRERCSAYRSRLLDALAPLNPTINGDPERTLPHVLNLSFPGLDSEAVMVALKDMVAISNGSACTSQSYEPSHVLQAMDLPEEAIAGAIRLSWCHMTHEPEWSAIADAIRAMQ